MEAGPLEFSVDEFLCGPQEIALRQRHGSSDPAQQRACMGGDIRRAIRDGLRSRELHCHVTFGVGHLAVKLRCDGVYEHEGHVCRIVYLSKQEAEWVDEKAEPNELEALKISGWVAQPYYVTPPKGLRLYYHVFASAAADAEICKSWYRAFPLAPDEEMTSSIALRTQRIAQALDQPDEGLPDCSIDERHGTPESPFKKCRADCPARAHCHQIRRYYEQATQRYLAGERALAAIIADPEELTFVEKERQHRKQQISAMLMAGNFFEDEFPREVFRKLILEEAADEATEPAQAPAYREMATSWSNADFVAWRAWLDSQD